MIIIIILIIKRFVCFDALHPSQQFFNHVGTGLHGSCLRTQHSDLASGESGSLELYQLNHCALHDEAFVNQKLCKPETL